MRAAKGERLLWAALDGGIYIPNLCAIRSRERPIPACRLCYVEIEGRPHPVTACTEPAAEGMVVNTRGPRASRLRRTAAELLIASHEVDCAHCYLNRHCELQRVAAYLRVKLKPERFKQRRRGLPRDESNPFFTHDPNKCILCGKCVWACHELQGAGAIDFAFRGLDTSIAPFYGEPIINSRCESCGECAALCPAGAMVPRGFKWPKEEVKSVCPYCGVGCRLYLGVDGGRVVSVRGDPEGPANRGGLCVKGRFGITGLVHHPERLTSPLIRHEGELKPATWDEALDFIAKELSKYRGSQFGLIASGRVTNEAAYLLQKFARTVMGSHNIDSSPRLCYSPALAAQRQSFGGSGMCHPIADIGGAACILAIGTDTTSTHPIVGRQVRQAARHGAKLIVASPLEIDLCRQATIWLQHRPGSDLALLLGMMKVIVEEGLADRAFIEARCQGYPEFEGSLRELDLGLMEHDTGLPRERVAEATRLYARTKPATIIYASGLTQHLGGREHALALADLALLTGNIGKPSSGLNYLQGQNNAQGACDMGLLPDFYPGYQGVDDPAARRRFEAAWGCPLPPAAGLDLTGMLEAAQLFRRKGRLKALYVVGANPMVTHPDTKRVREALGRANLLIVQDMFLSETARLAHVVLPASSFAEGEGSFTNTERRVQQVRPAIAPLGGSRPDWQIVCQVARRLGARGFDFVHPAQVMEEIGHLVPDYGGISYQRLEQGRCPEPAEGGLCWPCPTPDHPGTPLLYAGAFPAGKASFIPIRYKGLEPPGNSLLLVTEHPLSLLGSSPPAEGLALLAGEAALEINPAQASALGVADGDMVRVSSGQGEIEVRARLTEALPAGVVRLRPFLSGSSANLLTSALADPVSGVAGLRSCPVRIERVAG